MKEYLHQTADARDSLSDSGCRCLSIRQRMQMYIHQKADAGVYQTADAGDTLSDSGCRRLTNQTADAGDSISNSR